MLRKFNLKIKEKNMFVYNVPFRKCHTHIGKFNYKTTDWSTKYNDNSYPYW